MNRRTFFSAALSVPLAARAGAGRVRIGFLGGSYSHAAGKLEVLTASPDWEVAGVWEEDPTVKARLVKSGVRVVSQEEILGDETIQVVAVNRRSRPTRRWRNWRWRRASTCTWRSRPPTTWPPSARC